MVKSVTPIQNGVVSKSNKLIEARYKLSLQEQKVLYSIITLVQPGQTELTAAYRFKAAELAKFCGIPKGNAKRDLEEITRLLLTRVLTIIEGDKKIQTHWVRLAEYDKGEVTFKLNHELMPYLLELKGVFTSIKVEELMSFKSQYSGRIYELLCQYKSYGGRKIYIDELREYLELEPDEYSMFHDIRRFIINPAVKDIIQNTPYDVTYEEEKIGRKVVALLFKFKLKPAAPEDEQDLFAPTTPLAPVADPSAAGEVEAAASEMAATVTQAKQYICPACGKGQIIPKTRRDNGKPFWGCNLFSRAPGGCTYSQNIDPAIAEAEKARKIAEQEAAQIAQDTRREENPPKEGCPICGGNGRYVINGQERLCLCREMK